ncbi:MAG: ABC transporter substrate-binding protein [Firmicutes bacterium]|nr:ABC transporter substrate-binding protein [Bacillota bacterium]
MVNRKIILGLLAAVLIIAAGCAPTQGETLVFADAGWDSIQFHNDVAAFIIENGYGYETSVMSGSTPMTFTSLREGSIDIYMETWQETFMDTYNEAIDSGDIIELSVNFDDSRGGYYVPTFVIEGDPERGIEPMAPDLRRVDQLHEYWELFEDPEDSGRGRIVGSPPGWEVDVIMAGKVEGYGLDEYYNYFSPGSDVALATALSSAHEAGEPIVGYYWEPTWLMGMYDFTFLEEDEYDEEQWSQDYTTENPSMPVTVTVNSELPDTAPDVVAFLENYQTSTELTNLALSYMQENGVDTEETALWFLKEYEDLWTQWVPTDVAEQVKEALAE